MILPLFQLDVYYPQGGPSWQDPSTFLNSVWIGRALLVFLGVIAFTTILFLIRWLIRQRKQYLGAFGSKILQVQVPKELRKEDVAQDKSQQQIQELIGRMETVFSTFGSLKPQTGFMTWLIGRNDQISCEIVIQQQKIYFYVVTPPKWQNFLEEQVHAQFPFASIEEVDDYNIFSPHGVALASYLVLRRASCFPLKTYRKLESDPMNSLTNALAKVEEGDGASIQFMLRPAQDSWRKHGIHIAREMQQGKKLSDVEKGGIWKEVWKFAKDLAKGPNTKEKGDKKPYSLSPLEQEMVKGLEEKAAKAGLETCMRVVVSAKTPERAQQYMNDLLGAFGQYNVYEYGNSLKKRVPRFQSHVLHGFIYRQFSESDRAILNAEELSSIFHFPLPSTETPKIAWLMSRKALPPSNLPKEGILLGHSIYRNQKYEVRMKQADRRRHFYMIGKSGTGKTELLKAIAQQDIEAGRGVCIIDPHGDFAEDALGFVPKSRAEDVIFFDPSDIERPMGMNMLEYDPRSPHLRTFVINEMLKIFDKLYDLKATGGPMFEVYMRNAILLLMDHPESGMTLMDIPRVLADEQYRNMKLSHCTSQEVKDFWTKEALKAGGEASLQNMVPYITSKLSTFIYNDYMRPIIGQQKSAFNMFDAMNQQKIIIAKLPKGKIGDMNAYLLGMIFVGKILDGALKRGDMPPEERKDFYLYIDEFQNFLTDSISTILSEARKYGLDLLIAHQFIGQLASGAGKDTTIRDAIFGNVGTMCVNRIGMEDAEFLAKEFSPVFTEFDLVNVEAFTFNMKLLIDNQASRPFNFSPMRARRPKNSELADAIKELSRLKYGRPRAMVEAEIAERRGLGGDASTDGEKGPPGMF
ncbi:type IV secretion system DNA-binding domain-containing protein [Patescibacteria group bacterium]|nr:type IV secretion system DNA-binding domain-containing protein [Patescibacteria group bacterium]